MFTIHNLAYQGNFSSDIYTLLNVSWKFFVHSRLEFYGNVSFIKAGIILSDIVTTVSPSYAKEIQGEEFGCGMNSLLEGISQKLYGVLNGIHYEAWNPATDKLIKNNYDMYWEKEKNDKLEMGSGVFNGEIGTITKIDERDITDLIYENNDIYDYMVFESLCLYEPIKENYNFMDLILDIEKENEIHIIPVVEYDSNVIHSSLEQVELFHTRGFKVPFIVINVKKDIFVSESVIEYIRSQVNPIKVHITEFDNMAENKKIDSIKYPEIIKDLF